MDPLDPLADLGAQLDDGAVRPPAEKPRAESTVPPAGNKPEETPREKRPLSPEQREAIKRACCASATQPFLTYAWIRNDGAWFEAALAQQQQLGQALFDVLDAGGLLEDADGFGKWGAPLLAAVTAVSQVAMTVGQLPVMPIRGERPTLEQWKAAQAQAAAAQGAT